MKLTLFVSLLLLVPQTGRSQMGSESFRLKLPEFFDRSFRGGLIEIPDRPVEQLQVEILDAEEQGITYGNVFVKINGKGAGNVFERRPAPKGLLLNMNKRRLQQRPDELIDSHENAIEVIAQDRAGRRYYQNWILRAQETGQNAYFAYASAMLTDNPADAPPDLIIQEPTTPPVLNPSAESLSVRLTGVVSAPEAGTTTTLNGRPFLPATTVASSPFDRRVVVIRQTNELMLEATDRRGNRRSVTIPVIVQSNAPARIRAAGNRYAIVIGISRFGDERGGVLPVLAGAAAQAENIASRLKSYAGFPAENVRLLLDEQANLEQVKSAFTVFAGRAKGDDLLLIYLNSYGLHDPSMPERLHLAVHGTRVSALGSTSLSFEDVQELINQNVVSNNTILIFDVAHELPAPALHGGTQRNMINRYLLNLFDGQEGRAVLVSGSAGQVAVTGSAGAEMFSSWLAEALAGAADVNGDRVLTAGEVFRFITERVRAGTGGRETPRFRLSSRTAEVGVLVLP